MPAYIPPHLRGKKTTVESKKSGVRWLSNATGEPSMNVKSKAAPTKFRNTNQTRSQKYSKMSKQLSKRSLRGKAVKTSLKRSTRKVRPSSAPAKL